MRRIKLILAAVAAVATMMLVAAPAMANVEFHQGAGDVGNSFSLDGGGSFSSQGVLSLDGSSHGDISFDGVDVDRNDIGDRGSILIGGLSSIG